MTAILPELILFGMAMMVLLLDLRENAESSKGIYALALSGFFAAMVVVVFFPYDGTVVLFGNNYRLGPVSQIFKSVLIFAGGLSALLGLFSKEIKARDKAPFMALMLLSTGGMCVLSSANHLVLIYLSFLLMSASCLVLNSFSMKSGRSSEAGTKLFWQEAVSMGLFSVGLALLFGMTNSFDVDEVRQSLAKAAYSKELCWVAFGFLFVSILSKVSAFPFYFTTPDFVQGVSSPAAGYYSVACTTGSVILLLKFLVQVFSVKANERWSGISELDPSSLMVVLSVVTMSVGNLSVLFQTNIKRIMGYYVVAQMGYLLLGLGLTNLSGVSASILSMVSFALVFMGAFLVLQIVMDNDQNEDIESLTGLVWRNPLLGVLLILFFLSLAGIPPLFGSMGRVYILSSVVEERLYFVAVLLVFNWVLGLAGYLPLIKKIFDLNSRNRRAEPLMISAFARLVVIGIGIPTIALGIWSNHFMSFIRHSMETIVW